jgi:hypothetical protein
MRIRGRSRRSREFTYVPLTPRDEAVRGDRRYRIGAWLNTWGSPILALAFCVVLALPIALLVDWRANDLGSERPRAYLAGTLLWLLALAATYVRWFAWRQERSERQRGYRFYVDPQERDAEIAAAKGILLSSNSTSEERDRAVELLVSRGAAQRQAFTQ